VLERFKMEEEKALNELSH